MQPQRAPAKNTGSLGKKVDPGSTLSAAHKQGQVCFEVLIKAAAYYYLYFALICKLFSYLINYIFGIKMVKLVCLNCPKW